MLHLVDIQLLTRAFKSFTALTGLNFALYDDRENLVIAPAREDPVLSVMKTSRKGQEIYARFLEENLKLSSKKTKAHLARGPAGQFHLFIPVRYKEINLVALGEAFYPAMEDFVRFYEEMGPEYGLLEKDPVEWSREINVLPAGTAECYIEAIQPLLENIIASGYEKGELSKHWQWSKTIINLAANIKSSTSLNEIRQMIIDTVIFLFNIDTVAIFSLRDGYFCPEAAGGRNRDVVSRFRIAGSNKFIAGAMMSDIPVSAMDSYKLWHNGFPDEIISMYLFPICSGTGMNGFLGVFNTLLGREAFDSINEICRITAYFLDVRNMGEEFDRKSVSLKMLTETTSQLYEFYKEPQKLYESIVAEAANIAGAEKCSLMLPEDGGDVLAISAVKGTSPWLMKDVRVRRGEGIAGKVYEQGAPILIDGEERMRDYAVSPKPLFKTASCLSMPLKVSGEVVGILNLSDKQTGESFSDADLMVLGPFALHASILLKLSHFYNTSQKMRELSITDPLTGLFNRRYFDVRLEEEFQRARRYGLSFSLAIMDIDDFKALNDTEGHMAGDHVLKELALIMNSSIRANDILVRFGGEEFAIIMPQTSKEEAFNVVERIRSNISTLMFRALKAFPGKRLTISTGIAMYPDAGEQIEKLIICSDRALYRAKMGGKNRSVLWEPDWGRRPG